MKLNISTQTR